MTFARQNPFGGHASPTRRQVVAALAAAGAIVPSVALSGNPVPAPLKSGATPVDTIRLGGSDLAVTRLCLGTMTFGGTRLKQGSFWRDISSVEPAAATRIVDAALDAGITFFDTANIYGSGVSEEIVGEALRGKRQRVVIATKVGAGDGADPSHKSGLTRGQIVAECEASLRRLRTDVIDLYQTHIADPRTPWDETLGALDELVKAGKVRHAGCSNLSGWQFADALATAEKAGFPRFVSYQGYYSLGGRDLEAEILPAARKHGIGVTIWGSLGSGFLTGKYRRDGAWPHGTRLTSPVSAYVEPKVAEPQGYAIVDELERIAHAHEAPVSAVALAWLLTRPGVSSAIFAVRTADQLAENLKAASLVLSGNELARLDVVSASPAKPYPYWHQQMTGVAS